MSDTKKMETVPSVDGIPGQDIKEEQPVRNPIDEKSTVLVVGSSRGIGLEFVKQCAEKGANVLATHRGENVPEGLQKLVDDSKLRVETLSLDVTDEESIAKAAQELQARENFTPLTHVIHNAGAFPQGRSFDGTARGGRHVEPPVTTKEDMMNAFLINSVGPLLVAQKFVPLLGRAPGSPEKNYPVYSILSSYMGSICLNTSGVLYPYRSSKAACNQVCKGLSIDLAGEASVVCLHPGYVRTSMTGGKGLIDPDESVMGMLRAIEATDATVGFRFVDQKGCILPW